MMNNSTSTPTTLTPFQSDILVPLRQEYLQAISPPQMKSLRGLFESDYLNPYALGSTDSQAVIRAVYEWTVGLGSGNGTSNKLQLDTLLQPPPSYRLSFIKWFIKQIETMGAKAAELLGFRRTSESEDDNNESLSEVLEDWYSALGGLIIGQAADKAKGKEEQFYRLYDMFGFCDALEGLNLKESMGPKSPSMQNGHGQTGENMGVFVSQNGNGHGESMAHHPVTWPLSEGHPIPTPTPIEIQDFSIATPSSCPIELILSQLPPPPIKILETQGGIFVSSGTTGLVTWEASVQLAKWLIEVRNSNFIPNSGLSLSNERVKWMIELGSGCGLLAISALKTFTNLRKYIATDGSAVALNKARENFVVNFHCLPDSRIHFEELDWENEQDWEKFVVLVERCTNEFGRGLLIGADIVFDSKLIGPLVRLVKRFQEVQMVTAHFGTSLLSCTVRNEDTMMELRQVLEKENLENRTVHSWENGFVLECSIIL